MEPVGAGKDMGMSYALEVREPVTDALRRAAREQADKALADLEDVRPDEVVEAVHDCRKRCKKVRGVARLVRPALGDEYAPANAAFRDAARQLSDLRDAHALLETFDALIAATADHLPDDGLLSVRTGLSARAQRATDAVTGDDPRIGRAIDLLRAGRARVDVWDPGEDWKAVRGGLKKTYGRGRSALAAARDAATVDRFHEWRKRVKYTWYHHRLLTPLAPSLLEPLADRFHDLSDVLGDAHDLAVLWDQLSEAPDEFGGEEQVATAGVLVDGCRADLERRAVSAGTRLYAESPKRFVGRLGTYWEAADQLGEELPAGEIGEVYKPFDGYAELTVDDLRDRVGALGVAGRWAMDRAELVATLRAANS